MYIVSNLKNINYSVHNKILLYYRMTPPLSKEKLEILNTELYTNMNFFGRDKLYTIMKEKYADHPSRRQVAEWLSQQKR